MAETSYNIDLILTAKNNASKELEKVSGQASSLWDTLKKIWVSTIALKTVKSLASSVLELWWNLEQAEVAYSTMLWSTEKAQDLLEQLSDFAKSTPFELTGVRETAKQLLAYWVSAEDMIPTLKSLWDISAWLWVDISRLWLVYWQVKTAWKLVTNDLKQFTNAWVPMLDELAKHFWTTSAAVQDMITKWQVSFEDVDEVLKSMTESGWRFADLMQKQSWTFQWMMSNLQDSFDWIKESIWMAILPLLEQLLEKISPIVEKISERVQNNPELASTIMWVFTAWLLLVWVLWSLSVIWPIVSGAIWLLTWPIWLVIWVIALLARAWAKDWWWIQEKTKEACEKISATVQPWIDKIKGRFSENSEAISIVRWALRDTIKKTVSMAIDLITGTLTVFFDWLSILMSVFTWDWEWAWTWIQQFMDDVAITIDNAMTSAFGDMRDNIKNWFMEWYNFVVDKLETLMNFVERVVDWIRNAWSNVKSSVTSFVNTGVSKVKSILKAGETDWARANWWPVYAWNKYLVWEKWPELFVPSQSGKIVPNNEITNNNWIEINISWVSVRNDSDIQTLTDEIIRRIKLEKNFWIA